jgi:DNA-binding CsgD family transcriptional regulator
LTLPIDKAPASNLAENLAETLTPKQREVFLMVSESPTITTQAIADQLGVSRHMQLTL